VLVRDRAAHIRRDALVAERRVKYDDSPKGVIRRSFARRRRNRLVATAFLLLLCAVAFSEIGQRRITPMMGMAFGVSTEVVGSIIAVLIIGVGCVSLYNWRCPACARYLTGTFNPRHCPNCGIELRT